MAITVGTNSWVTEAYANTYMGERLGAADYWTDGAANNARAIITAWTWLTNSPKFSFPTAVASITTAMKYIQCEMALFLLQHQPDIDLRMGLQAQGVTDAGIVKEKYSLSIHGIPLPATVVDMAQAYLNQRNIYIIDLERDEEQLTSYDAVTNLPRND